jgi:N-acetylmuramoyl-L-alanine amidase
MRHKLLYWAIIFVCLTSPAMATSRTWELVRVGGLDYVTLDSFCRFYGFAYRKVGGANTYQTQNEDFSVQFYRDSREMKINNVRSWLSFPVVEYRGDWAISRMDLVKHIEPILRPSQIEGKPRQIDGVVIDAGHGGDDQGAVSRLGKNEKAYALDTALRLEKLLKLAGLKVVMTRRTDRFIDLYQRARIATKYAPNYIFVSVHYNSGDSSARGIETYALAPRNAGSTEYGGRVPRNAQYGLPGNRNDALNILLAHEVQQQMRRLNPRDDEADRGVKRARFVVLKQNSLPAVLVECGFLSNRVEARAVNTPQYRQRAAEAMAAGIRNFIARINPEQRASQTTTAVPASKPGAGVPAPVTATPKTEPVGAKTPNPASGAGITPPKPPAANQAVISPVITPPVVTPAPPVVPLSPSTGAPAGVNLRAPEPDIIIYKPESAPPSKTP